jgi:undecaprenyl-diphosphatase
VTPARGDRRSPGQRQRRATSESALTRLRSRFSPGGWFLLQLAGGAALFIVAAWIFGGIAEDVVEKDPITVLDAELASWLHLRAFAPFTRFMLAVSSLHGIAGVSALTAVFALYLLWRRERYWLLALLLAVPGGMLLNVLMKYAFRRERPRFDDPLVTLATYSFPSGHTLAATVLYGALAAYLLVRVSSTAARCVVLGTALLLVTLVAFSRMYLGAHFLSDVLAAIAEGVAWLSLCLMATTTLQRRNAPRAGAHAA